MSKRFTDTDKWRKVWFRSLTPLEKCFWLYICDTCDHAGIWEVDFSLAEIFIGEPLNISEIEEKFRKQYEKLQGGKKWFIPSFVDFQYITLSETNRMHLSVINTLKKEGAFKPLISPLEGAQVKEQEQYKDKDKDKDKKERIVKENQKFVLPDWIDATAWNGFLEMRKKHRYPLTEHALNLAVTELEKLKEQGEDPSAVLNQSTLRGYRGLFTARNVDHPQRKPERFNGKLPTFNNLNTKDYSEGVNEDGSF